MFVERIIEHKRSLIRQYPVNSNRASEIGHPCLRYLTYSRTHWQERALHDVGLQMIFDMGNEVERIVMRMLDDANVKVIEQQRSYAWTVHQLTGHIDGKLIENGNAYPFDVKSSSPYIFDSIQSLDDLKRSKYQHLRKYPAQLQCYLMMGEEEQGLFIFMNKVSGALKEIWMDRDELLGQEIIDKCLTINDRVKDGSLPDRIEYDDQVCGSCAFAHICLPDRAGCEAEIVDDAELEAMLDRLQELKDAKKEYESLDKEITAVVKGRDKLMVGNWWITGKWVMRKGFTIEDSKYWKRSISRI